MFPPATVAGGSNNPNKAEDEDDEAATPSSSWFVLDASAMVPAAPCDGRYEQSVENFMKFTSSLLKLGTEIHGIDMYGVWSMENPILDSMFKFGCSSPGVQVGVLCISCFLFFDGVSLPTTSR
jgi:hypothetical protein